ncbi:MAG: sugar-binding transcriptional regulator [Tissierellia bacterium]|nr:sugar-binding transcriptional regulator [Tissierellia bacterium]
METLNLIKIIAPEAINILEERYLILRTISYNQPIGRRSLSDILGFKERAVRDQVNFLRNQGLLKIDFMGMYITDEGIKTLESLHPVYNQIKGIPELEVKLKKLLNIRKVSILPGNSRDNGMVLRDMGKITSKVLKSLIKDGDIVGITGGSTMAAVAEEFVPDKVKREVTFIPARGGLGRDVETQANSIVATFAKKLGGTYRLLFVPDGLEKEALEYILRNEDMKESLSLIDNMDILIFGIGRADTMAKRRNLPEERVEDLISKGAVAEAFGHYFDVKGNEVWEYKTVGLSLNKFKSLYNVIAVAGGEEKAEAIISIATLNENMILITDEFAAKKILELVDKAT